jgi:hypothetical protein
MGRSSDKGLIDATRSHEADNGANGDAKVANTGLAAHDGWIVSDAGERRHDLKLVAETHLQIKS